MLILLSGAAASGKSEYAEDLLIARSEGMGRSYLATMERQGEAAAERIARHVRLRAGKGFETLECPRDIRSVLGKCREAVLLEDLPNLLANEMFGREYRPVVAEKLAEDILALHQNCRILLAVTDDIFSDGLLYDEMTEQYRRELGRLGCLMGREADMLIEVSCGIPLWIKGKECPE